eukprot:1145264-Pelagomonas_calceolata.AAC.4
MHARTDTYAGAHTHTHTHTHTRTRTCTLSCHRVLPPLLHCNRDAGRPRWSLAVFAASNKTFVPPGPPSSPGHTPKDTLNNDNTGGGGSTNAVACAPPPAPPASTTAPPEGSGCVCGCGALLAERGRGACSACRFTAGTAPPTPLPPITLPDPTYAAVPPAPVLAWT